MLEPCLLQPCFHVAGNRESCIGHRNKNHTLRTGRVGACWDANLAMQTGSTPNLPTKIIPTKICRLKVSGRLPVDLRIPPLNIKIVFEPNPLKSRILVWRLAAGTRLQDRASIRYNIA